MAQRRGAKVEVKLRRDLGLLDIVMIGLGPTIGTTIFLLVGPGFAITGPSLLLAFGLNFVVTLFTAMAYMELGSAFPETGGGYLWIRKAMKEPWGFLGGWMSWFGHCVVAAFYIFGFGLGAVLILRALGGGSEVTLFGLGEDALVKLFAVLAAGIFIALNYRGTRITGRSEAAVTAALVGIVLAFIAFALLFLLSGRSLSWDSFQPFFKGDTGWGQFLALLGAMGFTFIVFQGYEIIAQTGEECREPEKNIPRATFLVIGLSTAIFLLVAFASIGIAGSCVATDPTHACLLEEGPEGPRGNENGLVAIAGKVMPFGTALVVFGIVLGALAATNSLIFSASRVSFAMGRGGDLPRALGELHAKKRTPAVSIGVSGLVIVLMALTLDIETVAASADIMFLLLFLQVNWAAIVLRRKLPKVKRYYIMPLFPLVPIVGIATKLLIAASLWTVNPTAWFIALAWIGAGLAVYVAYERREAVVEIVRAVESMLPRLYRRYRILLPVEEFERRELVDFAALAAQVEGGELTLLHVVEVPASLPVEAVDSSYIGGLQSSLGKLRRRGERLKVATRARVEASRRVFDAVMTNLQEEDIDLLILGWRGIRRQGRVLGTNVDRFVRKAPCDVVVFKSAGLRRKLRRILVMNAPGWHASYATGYAILLAKKHGASITILTAARTDREIAKERIYSERLAAMCRTHDVRHEERFLKVRNITGAVVEASRDHDLLALGASEARTRRRIVFGTVQDRIARMTPVPVLMVRKVVSRPLPGRWRFFRRLLRPSAPR